MSGLIGYLWGAPASPKSPLPSPPKPPAKPKLKLYLAGAYEERGIMRARANTLVGFCDITHRWFDLPETRPAERTAVATRDLQGVRDADAVFACIDVFNYPYRGTWTEVGAAIALGKHVIIYMPLGRPVNGPGKERPPTNANESNVFAHHPGVQCFTLWDDAIKVLKGIQTV